MWLGFLRYVSLDETDFQQLFFVLSLREIISNGTLIFDLEYSELGVQRQDCHLLNGRTN